MEPKLDDIKVVTVKRQPELDLLYLEAEIHRATLTMIEVQIEGVRSGDINWDSYKYFSEHRNQALHYKCELLKRHPELKDSVFNYNTKVPSCLEEQ